MSFRWIDPDYRWLVQAHALDDLRRVLARGDEGAPVVERGRDRMFVQFAAGPSGNLALELKRYRPGEWREPLARLVTGHGLATSCRREWQVLGRLRGAGILCPRPIACLEAGFLRRWGALVVAPPADVEPLPAFLAGRPFGAREGVRELFFQSLGESLARVHSLGLIDLQPRSMQIAVRGDSRSWEFCYCDPSHARSARQPSIAARGEDLAMLLATLPAPLAQDCDRAQLLDAYVRFSQLEPCRAELAQKISNAMHRFNLRHDRAHRPAQPTAASAPLAHQDGMWIDRMFRPHLTRAGLASFDAVMQTSAGHRLRALRDRENWRLELDDGQSPPLGAYLKRHHQRSPALWLRARLGFGPPRSPGRDEANSLFVLSREGVAAMRLIAFGEKLHADGQFESFVLTEELAGFTQLDHFIRNQFTPLAARDDRRRDRRFDRLVEGVADLAGKFHRLGYNHRDLYCCHFFVRETSPKSFDMNLIDLQRVQYRKLFRWRWLIKDLAQLAYSAPVSHVTRTHRLAFIKRYLGTRKLDANQKRFVRSIVAKWQRMERRLGKHP